MAKEIAIISYHHGRATRWEGTIEYLCTEVFGYSLECGHSWNNKIPIRPKTAKSLVKALNDSAYECNRYSDSYDLGTEADLISAKERGWYVSDPICAL